MVLTRVRIPRRALGREVHILLLAAHPVTRPSWLIAVMGYEEAGLLLIPPHPHAGSGHRAGLSRSDADGLVLSGGTPKTDVQPGSPPLRKERSQPPSGQSGGNTTTPASTGGKTGQSTTAPAKPAEKTIELQTTASGEGTVMIWENGSSSSQKFSGNWSKTYTGDETKDLTMLSVSGDIMGGDDQTVSCKVIVNGQEKVSKDTSGSIGSATCDIPLF